MDVFDLFVNVAASTLRLATPLILAAMAGLLSYQVGLINIALEGLMLTSAFVAVAVGFTTGSTFTGILAACAAGAILAALFALFVTDWRANLIVTGLAVNLLAAGSTAYLLPVLFDARGTFAPPELIKLGSWPVPGLSGIPAIGRIFFEHSPLVYVSWATVLLVAFLLYRTRYGVHLRAVGENPDSARTAGISVRQMQYLALMLGGVLCGLAGAHLAVGDLALFRENMVSGRGFIALAAVYFAAGRPGMSALACVLFGLFEALQFRLQTTFNIPPQFFQMLPYIMVILMLVGISVRKEWKKGWS